MKLTYSTRIQICLYLEDYHNAGLSSEQTKEIIENITNPIQKYCYSPSIKLRCSPMFINGNWIVNCDATTKTEIMRTVDIIKYHLDKEIKKYESMDKKSSRRSKKINL